MVQRVKNRSEYTYRCRICGFENLHTKMPQTDVPVTKIGDYGANGTPTPETYNLSCYDTSVFYPETPSISYFAAAGGIDAYMLDTRQKFVEFGFMTLRNLYVYTSSGLILGNYTISERGVSPQRVYVEEDFGMDLGAAEVGYTIIYKRSYRPSVSTGCPFCGSLASR